MAVPDDSIVASSPQTWKGSLATLLWRCGGLFGTLAAVAVALLYAKQESLLYFPEIGNVPRRPGQNPRKYRSPAEHGIPYETHMIRCDDGVSIHSWLLLHPHSRQDRLPTLIFFHGNAGNIGLRLPNAIQMFNYLNANVLLVEYRGYGDSDDAKPTESGLKRDSEAALRFISEHQSVDPARIFVFGRSLGGAVAFHLGQHAERNETPLAGVIVENTFVSISKMVDHLMPLIAPLKSIVLRIGWDSGRIAPRMKSPILYLAGAADQLVPHDHMQELYRASRTSSVCPRIHVIKDGTHNETWLQGGREYWLKIRAFIDEVLAAERSAGAFRSPSASDAEEWSATKSSSVAVGMGMETETETVSGSSIPTMPANLMGMAKEATAAAVQKDGVTKKDI